MIDAAGVITNSFIESLIECKTRGMCFCAFFSVVEHNIRHNCSRTVPPIIQHDYNINFFIISIKIW